MSESALSREFKETTLRLAVSFFELDGDVESFRLSVVHRLAGLAPTLEVYSIRGIGFERPVPLHTDSYMLFAIDRTETFFPPFVELSPSNTNLGKCLASRWEEIQDLSPLLLAEFVLWVQSIDPPDHHLILDSSELKTSKRWSGFVLSNEAEQLLNSSHHMTTANYSDDEITIKAFGLRGTLHEKQDLGFTQISIRRDGEIKISERETICNPVFSTVPQILYS